MRVTSMPVLTIASFTVKGYIKERVLLVVLIFGFILMVSSYVLSPLAVGAQKKIIVDIGLGSISMLGILLVVLLGASSYSREKQGGILAALLAKPISRVDFVVGKYLGTTVTIAIVMLVMAVMFFAVMLLSQTPFNRVVFIAVYLAIVETAIVTSFMTFFSSFTSPMLSAFATLCVFISGHLSKDLLALVEHVGGRVFHGMIATAYYILPNLSFFNVRAEAVHGLTIPAGLTYSATIYGTFYCCFLILVSSLIFRARDVS